MSILKNDFEIEINNTIFHYTDNGPKNTKAIIFIHGFPFNKTMWNDQVELLRDCYRVITYDVRGHGNSGSGTEKFSLELFVKDLIIFMDALAIEKAILCGLSMGGYIALNAMVNFPNRFESIILCDTSCYADSVEIKEKRMKVIDSIREKGVEFYANENIKNLFAEDSYTSRKDEVNAIKDMITSTSVSTLINTLNALKERNETCSKLSEIKVPVLIMVGVEDKLTPVSAAQFMHDQIHQSELHILDHAGHLSNLENPEAFNYILNKFIVALK